MKRELRIPLLLLIACVVIAGCQSTGDPQGPPFPGQPTLFDTTWDDREIYRDGLILSEQAVTEQLEGATVYHMDIGIDDSLERLEGAQEVRYTNQETVPLGEVQFRLYPNLLGGGTDVGRVEVDGQPVDPTYSLADSAMTVRLPSPLQPGDSIVIKIDYSVTVPTEAERNYMMFAFAEDILALAHFYPMISVYDDEGWNLEIPSELGDVTYGDSSFFLVRVTAPDDLTLVATGVEIDRQSQGNKQRVTYAGGPARDFYIAASDDFAVVSQQIGETRVNSYAPSDLRGGAQTVLEQALDSFAVYSERFGEYPYSEFDLVSTPTLALGIEYPGVVAIAVRMYDPETSPYPPVVLESTVAHEAAHQWFYSTVGNDQLDEPWLDESITQYLTLLYYADKYGPSGAAGFRGSLEDRWSRVGEAPIPIGMPVEAYRSAEYGAIVYGRGPLFMEALEKELGEQAFAAFLRDYYQTHKWGIATTESLKKLAETHCACDLTEIFEEWVYSP